MWNSIDSAPKDRLILAVDEYGIICLCQHYSGKYWRTVDVDGGRDDYYEPVYWADIPSFHIKA